MYNLNKSIILVFLLLFFLLNLIFWFMSLVEIILSETMEGKNFKLIPNYSLLFIFILSIFVLIVYDLFKFKLCYYYEKLYDSIIGEKEINKDNSNQNYILVENWCQ